MAALVQLTAAVVFAAFLVGKAAAGSASTTLVINEVDYDQPGTDTTEFVEIMNISPNPISLSGYSMWLIDTTGSPYNQFTLNSVTIPSGGYYVVCSTNSGHITPCNQQQLADTSQSDRTINLLRNGDGNSIAIIQGSTIIDSVTYGDPSGGNNQYTEGSPSITDDASYTSAGIARCPNGISTFNNYNDFDFENDTPGSANSCPGYSPAPPPPAGTSPPPPPKASPPPPSKASPPPPPGAKASPPPPPSAKASPPPPPPKHSPPPPVASPPPPSANFTFYFMVNQWPGSWDEQFCTDSATPWTPSGPTWTLHGLWPNYAAPNSYPSNCDPNYPYSSSELDSSLLQDMSQYWPSYSCPASGSDVSFWTHEWDKHGTCAEAQFTDNSGHTPEYNYINALVRTLRIQQVDIYTILKNAGITPGASYSSSSIASAAAKGLGVSLVYLNCGTAGTEIVEIWVCVSTSLKIISCNPNSLETSTCESTISYPLCNAAGAPC